MAEQGPLSGQKLGDKYLLGNLLGQGGFGVVYQAQHLLLGRPQAVKILLEQHFSSPKFRERFLREARTLAALDHINILPVHEFGIEGSRAYLVMPYIAGGTLHTILSRQRGPLPPETASRYLEQIGAALDYAHARNVAHLDLKPLNLLVHEDGRLLLSDFGLAHLMEQGAIEGSTSLQFGTPSYMAPEYLQGRPEQRSDVYALGIILYQMLTGRVPFEGSNVAAIMLKHLTEPPPPLRTIRPDLSPQFEGVLTKALTKDPTERYATAGALLADFQSALGGSSLRLLHSNARCSICCCPHAPCKAATSEHCATSPGTRATEGRSAQALAGARAANQRPLRADGVGWRAARSSRAAGWASGCLSSRGRLAD